MRYLSVLAIGFAAVGLFAGVATAHYHGGDPGNVRAVFYPVMDEYEGATGHVVLNAAEGKPRGRGPHANNEKGVTIVQVNVRGLKPNTTYEFNLTHGAPAESFTTRRNGSANLHYELGGTGHVGHLPATIYKDGDPILEADK